MLMPKKQSKLIRRKLDIPFKKEIKGETVTFRIEPDLKRILVAKNVNISKACREYLQEIANDMGPKK